MFFRPMLLIPPPPPGAPPDSLAPNHDNIMNGNSLSRNYSNSRYNITVIGAPGVGKSALTLQFLYDEFVEEYEPTRLDSFATTMTCQGKDHEVQITDTAGHEEYMSVRDTFLRNGEGFICVFSLTDPDSFGHLSELCSQVTIAKGVPPSELPFLVVGNKMDLTRAVSREQAEQMTQSLGVGYMETSAKLNRNVAEAFHTMMERVKRGDYGASRNFSVGSPELHGTRTCVGVLGRERKRERERDREREKERSGREIETEGEREPENQRETERDRERQIQKQRSRKTERHRQDLAPNHDNIMNGNSLSRNYSNSRYNITVIGAPGVGKSALTLQFLYDEFVEEYEPTRLDSFATTMTCQGKDHEVQITDTAGHEEYMSVRDTFLRNGEGFICVFSLTDPDSFGHLSELCSQVTIAKGVPPSELPFLVVGNKMDLTRAVSREQAEQMTQSLGVGYMETSAKLNRNNSILLLNRHNLGMGIT
eukprot:sb/3464292/